MPLLPSYLCATKQSSSFSPLSFPYFQHNYPRIPTFKEPFQINIYNEWTIISLSESL